MGVQCCMGASMMCSFGAAPSTLVVLPTGDGLDPFYSAKAMAHVAPGSMLWVSGRRPGVRIVTGA